MLKPNHRAGLRGRCGYTLVEMLTATLLTLMMMGAVATLFESIGGAITDSRALLEVQDRLRGAAGRLQADLASLTVTVQPPRRPEANEGGLEIIEGPVGPVIRPEAYALDSDTSLPDTTVGDNDDILWFTVRSSGQAFLGRSGGTGTIESDTAEVVWFVRGRTLYRRVLLVAPHLLRQYDTNSDGVLDRQDAVMAGGDSFHRMFDVSARPQTYANNSAIMTGWAPNTLGDLTKRENRFAHRLHATQDAPPGGGFPFSASRWGQLGLPTASETSSPLWMTWPDIATLAGNASVADVWQVDFWLRPHPWTETIPNPAPPPATLPRADPTTGILNAYAGPAVGEDVILTDVIGFDVKVWDPNAPIVTLRDTSVNPPRVIASLVPGDPGYLGAVANIGNTVGNISYAVDSLGAYADLNYLCPMGPETSPDPNDFASPYPRYKDTATALGLPLPHFFGAGDRRSGLRGMEPFAGPPPGPLLRATYDTWSFHYENDGIDQFGDGRIDPGTNGFDDNAIGQPGYGVVDDPSEMETSPPYPVPLRGIQVKIRVFEPGSRQVREVTVVQDFLPK